MSLAFKFENLTIVGSYNDLIIENVDYEFHSGQVYAFLIYDERVRFELMKAINSIIRPANGRIIAYDIHENEIQNRSFRNSQVVSIYKTGNLIPYLDGYQNLEIVMRTSLLSKQEKVAKINEAFMFLGIDVNHAMMPTSKMYMTDYQLASLGKAIVSPSRVIACESLVKSLDSGSERKTMGLVVDIAKAYDKSALVITGRDGAARAADVILTIENNKLVDVTERVK